MHSPNTYIASSSSALYSSGWPPILARTRTPYYLVQLRTTANEKRGVWTRLIITIILKPDSWLAGTTIRRGAQCYLFTITGLAVPLSLSLLRPPHPRADPSPAHYTPLCPPLQPSPPLAYHMASVMGSHYEAAWGSARRNSSWNSRLFLLFFF